MKGLIGKYLPDSSPKYFKGPNQPRLGDLAYSERGPIRILSDGTRSQLFAGSRPGLTRFKRPPYEETHDAANCVVVKTINFLDEEI
jgi:hypothetical protein